MNAPVPAHEIQLSTCIPPGHVAGDRTPWVPLSAGKAFRPLRFLAGDRGFVELLRLDPGEAIARHRHTGEVHAVNLQGWRELDDGRRVGPGDYVYEPAGNIDAWRAIGTEALIVFVVVSGAVEYLDRGGHVAERYTASRLDELYRRHCAATATPALDLYDRAADADGARRPDGC